MPLFAEVHHNLLDRGPMPTQKGAVIVPQDTPVIAIEFKEFDISAFRDLTAEIPPIDGKRNQLQQVILNPIHNAVEAMSAMTSRGRVLRLGTKRHGTDTVAVAVQDSGPGIDPEAANHALALIGRTGWPKGNGEKDWYSK